MPRALLDLTVLATESRVRGIGRYLSDLATGLSGLEQADVEVLGVTELPWLGPATLSAHLDRAAAALIHPDNPELSYASWGYRVRTRLAAAARRAGADLLHSGHPGATPFGEPSCPRVVTCHDLIPLLHPDYYARWSSGFGPGRLRLDRRRYRGSDHVIAISRATADDLMRVLGLSADRISVVHNGVDLDRWQANPDPQDESALRGHGLNGRRYLLGVGDADWRKNTAGTVAGFARARRERGLDDLLLVWAGVLSSQRRGQIERAARALDVEAHLRFVGYVTDGELAALYRSAVALLFVSRAEGFGYPIVEAMACGCPVITSSCSSMAEIASEAAVTVDPEDHGVISAAIATVASDPQPRRRAGVQRAQQFSLARMAQGTLDVYRELAP